MDERPDRGPRSQESPLDLSALSHLRTISTRSGETVATVLLRSFRQEVPQLLDNALQAARAADWRRVAVLAGGMRSACAIVGATKLARRCADLERAASEEKEDRARRLLPVLVREHARAVTWLEATDIDGSAPPKPAARPIRRQRS
ncbi:MAG: Hpt domain-containing protein [Planctomycetota bacterium]